MNIILETILGLAFIFGVVCVAGWFLFREQFLRAIRYFKLWMEQDAKREAREAKVREKLAAQELEIQLQKAAALEKAEAEVEELEGKSQL
ncbi:MAG: hypothetical protein WCI55_14270 [Armatimonadota bacterium]